MGLCSGIGITGINDKTQIKRTVTSIGSSVVGLIKARGRIGIAFPSIIVTSSSRKSVSKAIVDGKKLIQRDKIIKLSYDFKLPANSSHLFINEKRILISQLKFDGGKFAGFSPAFAFYVHKGGAATCVDYDNKRTSKKFQISNHTKIPSEINIYDGEWHKVEFIFKLGTNDGYCLIKIDGKKIIEKFNYDNDLDPNEQIVSRFGPYRDESKNTHIIYYDNIEVGYFK